MKFGVEVWEIQAYTIDVEADDATAAEAEARRILQDTSPEEYGCEYGDRWVDVMEATEKDTQEEK